MGACMVPLQGTFSVVCSQLPSCASEASLHLVVQIEAHGQPATRLPEWNGKGETTTRTGCRSGPSVFGNERAH